MTDNRIKSGTPSAWFPQMFTSQPIHTPHVDRLDPRAELVRMGVVPETMQSTIASVLPPSRLSRETIVRVPGRVLWFDPDLARQLGFDVPPSNELTPELERQILEKFSFRILRSGEQAGDRETLSVISDRYGGVGTTGAGSGRAVFLPYLNACLKGVGLTELGRVDPYGNPRASDYQHMHGHLATKDAAVEAAWGLLGDNLFELGSSRVLAMIDIDEHTSWGGSTEHSVIEVRVGNQLRPAHVLFGRDEGGEHSLETFLNMARESGLLVESETGRPSIDETMKKVVAQHALTAAEQYSFRVLHGALSTANMEFAGGQLDLTGVTSQDRTAPIVTSETFDTRPFGGEQISRLDELIRMYTALVKKLSKAERKIHQAGRLDVAAEFGRAYQHFLERELLQRAGLKKDVAELIQQKRSYAVGRLAKSIVEMGALANDQPQMVESRLPDRLGVLDVFNLLREYPRLYFASNAPEDRVERELAIWPVRKLLDPKILGGSERERKVNTDIRTHCATFIDAYRSVMESVEELALGRYGDVRSMQRSIINRARFQNEPISEMYRATFHAKAIDAVQHFRDTGDRRIFRELIDKRVAASLRNVDALFRLGTRTKLDDGGIELEKRTIDGITYSMRAWSNGDRTLRLSLPISGSEPYALTSLEGAPRLYRDQIVDVSGGPSPLRFHHTLDGWHTQREVGAEIIDGQIVFEIDVEPNDVGRIEGAFHCLGRGDFWLHRATPDRGDDNYRGYTFAAPDGEELERLAQTL